MPLYRSSLEIDLFCKQGIASTALDRGRTDAKSQVSKRVPDLPRSVDPNVSPRFEKPAASLEKPTIPLMFISVSSSSKSRLGRTGAKVSTTETLFASSLSSILTDRLGAPFYSPVSTITAVTREMNSAAVANVRPNCVVFKLASCSCSNSDCAIGKASSFSVHDSCAHADFGRLRPIVLIEVSFENESSFCDCACFARVQPLCAQNHNHRRPEATSGG